jgi:hypothetical protein
VELTSRRKKRLIGIFSIIIFFIIFSFIIVNFLEFFLKPEDIKEPIYIGRYNYEYESVDLENLKKLVTTNDTVVRNTVINIISDVPDGIDVNSLSWKIWKINYWVSRNIKYISDPTGKEYFGRPRETIEIKAGDCDDIAILTASMYGSVGLDSALILVDIDKDDVTEHISALVYYPGTSDEFLDEERIIMEKSNLGTVDNIIELKYFSSETLKDSIETQGTGIWIVADPIFSDVVGYITDEDYKPLKIVDVGYRFGD